MTRSRLPHGLVLVLVLVSTSLIGCGGNGAGNGDDVADDGDGGSDGNDGDGSVNDGDGGIVFDGGMGTCMPGVPECADGCDNDGDGYRDGADVECTGALDNDESSFSTGIPGDNRDSVKQDCFFDGNSGSGANEDCDVHVCCLLGAATVEACPIGANQYVPAECAQPQSTTCQNYCEALTPPGCDCFGCCTICDPATDDCFDIITNPLTAPLCDASTIGDPTKCPACVKQESCNNPCGGCVLCPGQTVDDLPTTCMGDAVCPAGYPECGAGGTCAEGRFCINNCCVDAIP